MAPEAYSLTLGVQTITLAEKLQLRKPTAQKLEQQQRRFFCENCKQEVFLQFIYCDKCGGQIEWPKEIKKVISSWKAATEKQKRK